MMNEMKINTTKTKLMPKIMKRLEFYSKIVHFCP